MARVRAEAQTAMNIALSQAAGLARLGGYWPQSKRGSNAQREYAALIAQNETLQKCLSDLLAAVETEPPKES